jgi:hypothetical protein
VVVSILIAMAVRVAAEWFARRANARLHGN